MIWRVFSLLQVQLLASLREHADAEGPRTCPLDANYRRGPVRGEVVLHSACATACS